MGGWEEGYGEEKEFVVLGVSEVVFLWWCCFMVRILWWFFVVYFFWKAFLCLDLIGGCYWVYDGLRVVLW